MRTKLEQIELARVKILRLQEEQDKIFEELVTSQIGYNDWAWDYCFNCPESHGNYAMRCRLEILKEINGEQK